MAMGGTEVGSNELIVVDEQTLSISTTPTPTPHQIERCGGVVHSNSKCLLPQSSTSATPSIGPLTPDSDRENAELINDLSSPSPLTLPSSPPTVSCFTFNQTNPPPGDNVQTPKHSVFDPFAPAPSRFLLAPHPRKSIQGMGANVVRRLNFLYAENLISDINHESSGETTSDEEHLFETVYSTILDAIFSEQIKELVAKVPTQVSDPDGYRTPKFAPRLNGIAEACPGAPVKSTGKYRNIDKELCRKLEF
ncbi:hypothetical protein Salat_2293100 [Sesamum alatum]|uniref:Uncharacterized protein n=1 Tax=Sesamum alatum TaxID=300844 RepID=A0AAE2CE56_9LAMI|nr:hypothetical protein Salat_2293100 [Sesamum alatum]